MEEIRKFIESHPYGWIVLETMGFEKITLKEISQKKGIKYETLKKQKKKFFKDLRQQILLKEKNRRGVV